MCGLHERFDAALWVVERADVSSFARRRNVNAEQHYVFENGDRFEGLIGCATVTGIIDMITHWPRPDVICAGSFTRMKTNCDAGDSVDALMLP